MPLTTSQHAIPCLCSSLPPQFHSDKPNHLGLFKRFGRDGLVGLVGLSCVGLSWAGVWMWFWLGLWLGCAGMCKLDWARLECASWAVLSWNGAGWVGLDCGGPTPTSSQHQPQPQPQPQPLITPQHTMPFLYNIRISQFHSPNPSCRNLS